MNDNDGEVENATLATQPSASPTSQTGGGLKSCRWCAEGDTPKFLDSDGTLCALSGEPGELSHASGDAWWPCLRFGYQMRCDIRAATPAEARKIPVENHPLSRTDDGLSAAPERIWIDEWKRASKRTVGSYFFVPFNESSVDLEDIREVESVEYIRADLVSTDRRVVDALPENCTLVAHDTGDGWCLAVEDAEHSTIAMLAWPEAWPRTQTAVQLLLKGFVIV